MISRAPTDFSVRLIFVSRWRADWRLGSGFPVNADAAGSGLSGKVPGRKSGFAGGPGASLWLASSVSVSGTGCDRFKRRANETTAVPSDRWRDSARLCAIVIPSKEKHEEAVGNRGARRIERNAERMLMGAASWLGRRRPWRCSTWRRRRPGSARAGLPRRSRCGNCCEGRRMSHPFP